MIKQQIKKYFYTDFPLHEGIIFPKGREKSNNFNCFTPSSNDMIYYHIYSNLENLHFIGIKDLLGYKDKTLKIEQQFDMVHPDDLPALFRAIKNGYNLLPNNSVNLKNAYCMFTYRLKHKKGYYITVLRETRALHLDHGKLGGHINRVTDISFLNTPKKVNACFGIGDEKYPLLHNKYQNLFTKREKEILYLLAYGRTSEEIASFLIVEKNTVDKHRQNLLAKAGVENTMQLITFSIENGLLNLPLEYKIPKLH